MNCLQLHPAVYWTNTPEGLIQLRLPTGNHITIDENMDDAERVLSNLRSSTVEANSVDQNGENGDGFRSQFLDILFRLNAVRVVNGNGIVGTFQQLADFHAKAVGSRLSRTLDLAKGEIDIRGSGEIFQAVADLVSELGFKNPSAIRIICADFEDANLFMTENANAIADKVPVTFIRWSREQLIIGPLVLTKNGPCYACYRRRIVASAIHVDEMQALLEPANAPSLQLDPTFLSFVRFAVGRHLSCIAAGSFHIARAGHVERWDPFKLDVIKTSPLSRVPRCEHCGNSRAHDPLRAVRDLI